MQRRARSSGRESEQADPTCGYGGERLHNLGRVPAPHAYGLWRSLVSTRLSGGQEVGSSNLPSPTRFPVRRELVRYRSRCRSHGPVPLSKSPPASASPSIRCRLHSPRTDRSLPGFLTSAAADARGVRRARHRVRRQGPSAVSARCVNGHSGARRPVEVRMHRSWLTCRRGLT